MAWWIAVSGWKNRRNSFIWQERRRSCLLSRFWSSMVITPKALTLVTSGKLLYNYQIADNQKRRSLVQCTSNFDRSQLLLNKHERWVWQWLQYHTVWQQERIVWYFCVVTCGNGEEAGVGDTVLITSSAAKFKRLQALIHGSTDAEKYLGKEMEVVEIELNLSDSYVNTPCYLWIKHVNDVTYHSIHPETITSVTARPSKPQLDNPASAERITPLSAPQNSPTQMSPTIQPVRAPDAPELRTITFEQITLEKKLGSGNFGIVYLARWNRTRCAVKQIQAQDIIQGRERDRILQEAVTHRLVNIVIRCQIVTPSWSIVLRGLLLRHLEAFSLTRPSWDSKFRPITP